MIWVDALCIDQRNVIDRSFQVAMTDSIDRQDENVNMRLGELDVTNDSLNGTASVPVYWRIWNQETGPDAG